MTSPQHDPVEAARDLPGPAARQLLPGSVVAYAWLLAAVPMAVLQLVHGGLHEHVDLPPVVHWLRDAALAVPLAAVAVVLAAILVRARLAPGGGPAGPTRARLGWAVLAAFLFAALSIPGNQLHGLLFGAEGEEMGWLEDALVDGSIALAASLATVVPAALFAGPPWRGSHQPLNPVQVPGSSLVAAPGPFTSPATAGPTTAGGDR
jgi:hypothetical protein